jgi:hypothetical protein
MEESHSVAGVPSLQYVRTILIDASCSSEAFSRFTCLSGGAKKAIMKELSLLGIDPFSVYGDLEHLAGYLTNAYT